MNGFPQLEFTLANGPAALLAFVPLILNLAILVYGYRKLTLDTQNVLYLLFVAGACSWQAFDVGVRIAGNMETAALFRGYFRAGQLLTINFGLHFVMLYVGRDRIAHAGWFWALLYVPPLVEFGSFMSGQQMEVLVYRPGWGWLADARHMHPVYSTYLTYGSVLSLVCMGLLVDHLRRVWPDPVRRRATGLLTAGFGLVVFIGVAFEVLLPMLAHTQWPITSSAAVCFAAAVLLGQSQFRLFDVSTPAAAKAVVETVPDELLIAGADGELLFANDEARHRFGLDPHRIGTYRLNDFLVDGDGRFAEAWEAARRGERRRAVEARLRLADGSTEAFLTSLAPIPLNRAGESGVAVVAHDIGELKAYERAIEQARDEAESASRTKSEFLASMSHELRTPLNVIIGYSELLEEEMDDEDLRADLTKIKGSGKHLLQLINDILDLSKVEAGRLEVHPEPIELGKLLTDLDPSLRQLATKNNNALEVQLPTPLPEVYADPMRVRQAVLNLVSNGAKFCEDGTLSVVVSVAPNPGKVLLDVSDTGIGMSPEQAGKLFGRFTQVHEDDHERYGGTGLGLALSRSLCRLMGGELLLHHTARGEGSTFRIELPLHQPDVRSAAPPN